MSDKMFTVRPATVNDVHAIGTLVHEAILSAPSSQWEWDELPEESGRVGHQIVGDFADEVNFCLVAQVGTHIVGFVQVMDGEFSRCQHARMANVLVWPLNRAYGVGRGLVDAMLTRLKQEKSGAFSKVSFRVSERDAPLNALLNGTGWRVEREIEDALRVEGEPVVVRVYARDL